MKPRGGNDLMSDATLEGLTAEDHERSNVYIRMKMYISEK